MQQRRYRTKDRHEVKSRAEVIVDNTLFDLNINHEYEYQIKLGEKTYKPDWYLPDYELFIEFWGMEDNRSYQIYQREKQKYKLRFKRRNRFDEILKKYSTISLEKMRVLMNMSDIKELEQFLVELPEDVPVKISGDNVLLGEHDATATVMENMNKALMNWEISALGDFSLAAFACQIDGGTHSIKEAHYQCKSCLRFVCETCYEALKDTGRIICPYCDGSLMFISSR